MGIEGQMLGTDAGDRHWGRTLRDGPWGMGVARRALGTGVAGRTLRTDIAGRALRDGRWVRAAGHPPYYGSVIELFSLIASPTAV